MAEIATFDIKIDNRWFHVGETLPDGFSTEKMAFVGVDEPTPEPVSEPVKAEVKPRKSRKKVG